MCQAIECHNVSFRYHRSNEIILRDISLNISQGMVYGLLGRNGSGKSTLLNIFSTLLLPTNYYSQQICIYGMDIKKYKKKVRKKVSLISGGERGLYYNLTGYENLKFFGYLDGLYGKKLIERINYVSSITKISSFVDKRVSEYSLGMKQRLHIAAGLLKDPDLMLLDEPTNGLDVEIKKDILKIILYLKQKNKSILISTHNLSDAEKVCDEISIIDKGKIIFNKTHNEFERMLYNRNYYLVKFSEISEEDIAIARKKLELEINIRKNEAKVYFHANNSTSLQTIESVFCHSKIISIYYKHPDLEDIYLKELKRYDSKHIKFIDS